MTNRSRFDDLVRREGDTDDQHASRIKFLERLTDWSEPGAVKVYRNGKLLGPLMMPDRVELRKRIFKLPWNRPKR